MEFPKIENKIVENEDAKDLNDHEIFFEEEIDSKNPEKFIENNFVRTEKQVEKKGCAIT